MCLICDQDSTQIMASIYYRLDKSGNKRYYGSIYNNGKRIRRFLGCSRQSARALIKKFEYELLLNIESSTTEYKPISFEQAILSFKKDIERTGVKVKQISVITNKVNYFKNYCFSLGVNERVNIILLNISGELCPNPNSGVSSNHPFLKCLLLYLPRLLRFLSKS